MIICVCHHISEQQIKDCIVEHKCEDVWDVAMCTGASTSCGLCRQQIQNIIKLIGTENCEK